MLAQLLGCLRIRLPFPVVAGVGLGALLLLGVIGGGILWFGQDQRFEVAEPLETASTTVVPPGSEDSGKAVSASSIANSHSSEARGSAAGLNVAL